MSNSNSPRSIFAEASTKSAIGLVMFLLNKRIAIIAMNKIASENKMIL